MNSCIQRPTQGGAKMTLKDFIKKTAIAGLILGMALCFSGCDFDDDDDHHDDSSNDGNLSGVSIDNPFIGITLGDSYWINSDTLNHFTKAFNTENLAKLATPMSWSQATEVVSTTNRASRHEDDFSISVAATAKAKFGLGSGSVSNAYNRSTSKVSAENTLTWTSRCTKTGQVFSIDWENYKYTDFYGCLSPAAQQKLANIFNYYGQTVGMISQGKIDTVEGKAVFAQYRSAVDVWYASYGYGFVSGVWVGMLGEADLVIHSTVTNTTKTWNNSSSISYSSPVAGGGLNIAVSGLSAEYSAKAWGEYGVAVMPAFGEISTWGASWADKFSGKLGSITEMLKVDSSPAAYAGTKVEPPFLELPSAKVNSAVSEKFQVSDLDSAKACAQVIDWEKNGKGLSFDDYLAKKEQDKKAEAAKFKDKDKGNFEDNVNKVVNQNSAVSFIKPDEASFEIAYELETSTATPWADFMNQWTTLGVYITRWSDVIPPLAQTADVSATDDDMTSGLAFLWAVRYKTQLTRFADYLDMCYPYALNNTWKTQAANITSFINQIRGFAADFGKAMDTALQTARTDPTYTCSRFFADLNQKKNTQIGQMTFPMMYKCWSDNYEFFKQADFGCGLVMMPGGFGVPVPQFIFAGLNGGSSAFPNCAQVNWSKYSLDSRQYLTQPGLFANYPKLLPLISAQGKIMFLMIGTNRSEGVDTYGILDAAMSSSYSSDGEVFTVDSLAAVDNESRVFKAIGVNQKIYTNFNATYNVFPMISSVLYGKYLYKDPGSSQDYYLMFHSAFYTYTTLPQVQCGANTTFYLVPLSGFTEGTKVRGVKISDELPDYVASPFELYSDNTAAALLEDAPSAVYNAGVLIPDSTESYMDGVLDRCRVWKGLLPEPKR